MSRLITFGCSFTYGHGLPDCIKEDGISCKQWPSKLGWVSILGKKLGLEVINLAEPGSSNYRILKNILEFDFQYTDIVVIQWSASDRDLIMYGPAKESWVNIGPWLSDTHNKNYYLTHPEYDMVAKSMLYIHHGDFYVRSKVAVLIHVCVLNDPLIQAIQNDDSLLFSIPTVPIDFHHTIDKAVDGSHPGLKSNKIIAEQIEKVINNE